LVHSRIWETLADTLLWLQLALICSGFALMGYLALKVFPGGSDSEASQKGSHSLASQKRELIMLGGYRFEVAQDSTAGRPNVIDFAPSHIDRESAAAVSSRHSAS
jgi:hypothetical protein